MLKLWEECDYLGGTSAIVTSDNNRCGNLAIEPGNTCRVWVKKGF